MAKAAFRIIEDYIETLKGRISDLEDEVSVLKDQIEEIDELGPHLGAAEAEAEADEYLGHNK